MLARRLAGILPPLDPDEALEVTRVWSSAGLSCGLVTRRPFRAPHHAISMAGLTGGGSRLVMRYRDGNGGESGGVHGGAVLALLDTTGAMASWAETGPGEYRASTPSIQAQLLAPPPKDDYVAYGRLVQRDNEILWSDVEVAGASDGKLWARGTVIYRILT